MISFTIVELRAGRTRPLGDKGHISAIDKQPTHGLVLVGPEVWKVTGRPIDDITAAVTGHCTRTH